MFDDFWSTGHTADERSLFQRIWRATGEKGLELAFTAVLPPVRAQMNEIADAITLHNWFFRPAFHDAPGNYVPVNDNTLAGAILRNLAWAPENDRLDFLLIRDFELKFNAAMQGVSEQRSRYEAAISRLFQKPAEGTS